MANNIELDMAEGSGIRTAVDIMVLNDTKNQILLGLRKVKSGENTWGFPGGHQITGEKIIATARTNNTGTIFWDRRRFTLLLL